MLHLDEKTPHLHIDYIPVADGYKNGMKTRNSISVALEKMGFGKSKNSINEWRIQERKILRAICEKYGMEIAEETKGRGKTFTPDEYKKIRDEAKEEIKAEPDFAEEIREYYIEENKADLVIEAQRQAEKAISEIKQALKETIRPLEGKIALEKRINAMTDGIKETTLFGKTTTTIKFDGTAEQAMTVLNAAKDRDNAKKAKDKAIADKETAVKELRDRKKQLDNREQGLNDREGKIAEREYSLDEKLKTAKGETQRYRQLYSQEKQSTTDLTSQLTHQKREAKRWEDNYNNLHRQYVQLKRSKGLEL